MRRAARLRVREAVGRRPETLLRDGGMHPEDYPVGGRISGRLSSRSMFGLAGITPRSPAKGQTVSRAETVNFCSVRSG
jgi:hypothetical protein